MSPVILILNPPSPDHSYINRDLMGGMGVKVNISSESIKYRFLGKLKSSLIRIPVMQLVMAATLLKHSGFSVEVIDAVNLDLSLGEIMPKIRKMSPSFVVMAVSSSCILFERDVVARKIKEQLKDAKIIVVGETVSENLHLLKQPFDIAVTGEVEKCIVDICENKDLSLIKNIAYKKHGKVIKNEREFLEPGELNGLPLPDWSMFPYRQYRYYPLLSHAPVASVLASRGCPYCCSYCPYSKNQGSKWRPRSAESVFAEVQNDITHFRFKSVFFRDPLFTLDKKRIEKLCSLILKNKLRLEFVFETRPELLDKPLIRLLYRAGCRAINLGIEDIHPEVLKEVNRKPVNLGQIIDVVGYSEKKGIKVSCFFILGLPGSTRKSIDETISFSRSLMPSLIEYKIATPYPGTALYSQAKKSGWIKNESYDQLGGYSSVMQVSDELTQAYLEKKMKEAFGCFYYSPNYLAREFFRGALFKNACYVLKVALNRI